jgi:flagellar motor protein MotB
MAAKKGQTIIIKRITAGHGGGHGGAWKVAYADFVTAMMCFFLVMWLMGADEETRASVAQYFNNPTSAWRQDLTSKETLPLGDRTGAGESLLKGADGGVPEDQVQRPSRPYAQTPEDSSDAGETPDPLLSDKSLLPVELVQVSYLEEELFEAGVPNRLKADAQRKLERLGQLARTYRGPMTILGTFDRSRDEEEASPKGQGSYEFQLSRMVALGKLIVEKRWAEEEKVSTRVIEKTSPDSTRARDTRNAGAAESQSARRRVVFTLTRAQKD